MKQYLLFDLDGLMMLSDKGRMATFYSLKRKGFRMAAFSGKTTKEAEQQMKEKGLSSCFSAIEGCDAKNKTKTDAAKRALKKLAVSSEKVYLIGNEELDMSLANALGTTCIGVAEWEEPMYQLMEAHADYVVRSFAELKEVLFREIRQDLGKIKGLSRMWVLFYPVVLFMLVRAIVQFTAIGVKQFLGGAAKAEQLSFSGNELAIFSALGFLIAMMLVSGIAGMVMHYVHPCMKLRHLFGATKGQYVVLAVTVIGYALGMNILLSMWSVTATSESYQQVATNQYSASLIVGLLAYGIAAPIAEEVLFRGILYGYLRTFFGVWPGIIASAVLFGVYHMNPVQGIYAAVMGIVFAAAYEYFCSFKVPVILHMGVNMVTYLLASLIPDQRFLMNIPVMVTCLAFGVVGTVVLAKEKH